MNMRPLLAALLLTLPLAAAPNQAVGLRLQPHRAITHESLEEIWLEWDLMLDGWIVTVGQEGPFWMVGRARLETNQDFRTFSVFKDLGTPKVRLLLLRGLHQQIYHPRPEPDPDFFDDPDD